MLYTLFYILKYEEYLFQAAPFHDKKKKISQM